MEKQDIFMPDQSRWVIIYIRLYDALRASSTLFKNYINIEQAEEDAMNFKKYLQEMGVEYNDIKMMPNPSN